MLSLTGSVRVYCVAEHDEISVLCSNEGWCSGMDQSWRVSHL